MTNTSKNLHAFPMHRALIEVVREKQRHSRVLDPSRVKLAISQIDKTFLGNNQQVLLQQKSYWTRARTLLIPCSPADCQW